MDHVTSRARYARAAAVLDVRLAQFLLSVMLTTQWVIPLAFRPDFIMSSASYHLFRSIFGGATPAAVLITAAAGVTLNTFSPPHSPRAALGLLISAVVPGIMTASIMTGPFPSPFLNSGTGTYLPLAAFALVAAWRSVVVWRVGRDA